MRSQDTSLGGAGRNFPETVSVVLNRIRSSAPEDRRAAFEDLCRRYWKPAYSYLPMVRGKANEDAKDLAQAFFIWLFEDDPLARFDPRLGRFRPFLKRLLRHFVLHHDKTAARLKRGGAVTFVPLEAVDVPIVGRTPEDPDGAFDAAWRAEIVERAVDAVRERLLAAGNQAKVRVFDEYDCVAPEARPSYDELGKRVGLS